MRTNFSKPSPRSAPSATSNRPVIGVIVGDPHLREDTPVCRTDDFYPVQMAKLDHLVSECRHYDCPLFCPGDVFNTWKPGLTVLGDTISALRHLPSLFITIAGNHDMPQHNPELLQKSGLGVMKKAGVVFLLDERMPETIGDRMDVYALPWGASGVICRKSDKNKVLLAHAMIWKSEAPFPGAEGMSAAQFIKRTGRDYRLIISGHNHEHFSLTVGNTTLINPGSMMRQSADQADHKPGYYLLHDDWSLTWVPFIIDPKAVTREHIITETEKSDRIEAFVSHIKDNFQVGLSFEKNMEAYFTANRVTDQEKKLILECMGEPQ